MSSVDIIVPAYKCGDTIEQTIRSLSNQTYREKRIIVVLDGPDSNLKNLLIKFRPSTDLVIMETKKNKGVAFARNTGLRASKANYIAFCDSDDVWHRQKLEIQMDVLGSKRAIVASNAKRFTSQLRLKKNFNHAVTVFEGNLKELKYYNPFYFSSVLLPRALINSVNFRTDCDHEDYQFLIDIFKNCSVEQYFLIKEKLVGYRVSTTSRSGTDFNSFKKNFFLRKKNFGISAAILNSPRYIFSVLKKRYFV